MIIKDVVEHNVSGDGFKTVKSTINKDKLLKLYSMLSNVYRNSIGSIVREYASNAYDANIEAANFKNLSWEQLVHKYSWLKDERFNINEDNVQDLKDKLKQVGADEPVVVGVYQKDGNSFFYVKDFGIGLSPERMEHIYFNYLDSTKESTDDEIGGFGIGAKSALSYTHTFFIDTVYNGVLYKYIMTKDEHGYPEGQLLYENETTESNGTTIRIAIKSVADQLLFKREIERQLRYLPNVFQDNDPYKEKGYNAPCNINEAKILESEHWKYSTMVDSVGEMHIALNNINYSIDWSELGMSSINVPIALKFSTGELKPTYTRESVHYTPAAAKAIKDKIETVVAYFKKKFEEEFYPTDDFELYLKTLGQTKTFLRIPVDGDTKLVIDMQKLDHRIVGKRLLYKPFVDAGIPSQIATHAIFGAYKPIRKIDRVSGQSKNIEGTYVNINKYLIDQSIEYVTTEAFNNKPIKNYFLLEKASTGKYGNIYIIKEAKLDLEDWRNILDLKKNDKANWRKKIVLVKSTFEKYIKGNSLGFYEDVKIDPNWHADFKAGKSRYSPAKLDTNEIIAKRVGVDSVTRYATSVKLLKELNTQKVIYALQDDLGHLRDLAYMFSKMPRFKDPYRYGSFLNNRIFTLITVSKRNFMKLAEEKSDKFVSAAEFIESDFRPFVKLATALKIREKILKSQWLLEFEKVLGEEIIKDLKEALKIIDETGAQYTHASRPLYNAILAIGEKHNYIDRSMIASAERIYELQKKIPLCAYLMSNNDNESALYYWHQAEYIKNQGVRVRGEFYMHPQTYMLKEVVLDNASSLIRRNRPDYEYHTEVDIKPEYLPELITYLEAKVKEEEPVEKDYTVEKVEL